LLFIDEFANVVYIRSHLLEGLLLAVLAVFRLLSFPRLIIDDFGEHLGLSNLVLILLEQLFVMLLHLEKELARQLHLVVEFARLRLVCLDLEAKLLPERV